MTNSKQEGNSTTIGMTGRTTQDDDKRFVSKRGTEFVVKTKPNGLFYIDMAQGGKRPPMCDELFTSRRFAEERLITYLGQHDPLNLAEYPGKKEKTEVVES